MNQRSLLPLQVVSVMPATLGTRDLSELATTIDGQDWAIKSGTSNPLLPISEYLGYRLAEAAQIGVPYWHLLQMPNGELVFGSRFEGGVSQWNGLAPADQAQVLAQIRGSLTQIITFDWFYGNFDRHANNLLLRKNRSDTWTALAFDFSEAGLVTGFPNGPTLPFDATRNTETMASYLRQIQCWDATAGRITILSLQAVTVEAFGQMLADAPGAWLDEAMRNHLLQWWASPAKNLRLNQIGAML